MEYINPVSVAQMANTQKDTSIPGAGYGLYQGFLEAQAANKANDFFDMSKAGFAQEYAKNQFQNQMDWQNQDLVRPALEADIKHKQATTKFNETQTQQIEETIKKLKQEGLWKSTEVFGQFADELSKVPPNPIARKAAVDEIIRRMDFMGLPRDETLNYDPNDPQSWDNFLMASRLAKHVGEYSAETINRSRNTDVQQGGESSRNTERIAGQTLMNREDNATQLEIAKINAAAQAGRMTQAEANIALDKEMRPIFEKRAAKQPLTAAEQGALDQYMYIRPNYPGTVLKNDPAAIRERAKAKEGGGMAGVMEEVDKITNPDSPDISNEQDMQLRRAVEKHGQKYEPDKYEYRINNGVIQKRPR